MDKEFNIESDFSDWVEQLESDERNENACSIDNPDCESCSG